MEKSFLELLEAEKEKINNIKFFKKSAIDLLKQAECSQMDCQKESCKRIASEYEQKEKEAEMILLQIRKEMKQYISFLETLQAIKGIFYQRKQVTI